MKCEHCSKEFKSKRSTARYCSPRCKLAYHRSRVSVTKLLSVSDDETVTDTVKCPECHKKDIYILCLDSQIADLVAELQRAQAQRKAKRAQADGLPFSKSRQVGY